MFSKYFDHTLLKAEATKDAVKALCREALAYNFASVCVHPFYVAECAKMLRASSVAVCTVAGFPFGANLTRIKTLEAQQAIKDGATEVDMVINIGALKSGDSDIVLQDIKALAQVCHAGGASLKSILETGLLEKDEKILAAHLAMEAGADYVKTSTGVLSGGATTEDVALLREVVGNKLGVKASGGIRDLETAKAMIAHGANRIGASASVKIIEQSLKENQP